MAFSADGKTLYAAVNGQNTVVAIDPAAGTITRTWNVGIAPRQVKLVGGKLYVTNEGGRPATAGDATQDSYGTAVPGRPHPGHLHHRHAQRHRPRRRRAVTSARSRSACTRPRCTPRATVLYVANTNDDTVSVVDTTSDQVVQTIATQPWRGSAIGYDPTGITVHDGRLLVSLGRANAIAVYKLGKNAARPGQLRRAGPDRLLPRGRVRPSAARPWSPTAAASTPAGRRSPRTRATAPRRRPAYGTHGTTASLTRFTLPSDRDIRETYTRGVRPERLGRRRHRRQARQRHPERAGGARAPADRRPVDHQARLPAGQGEPDLRPGLRRHARGQRRRDAWRSSASR